MIRVGKKFKDKKKKTQSQSIVFPLGSFIVKKPYMLGFLIN